MEDPEIIQLYWERSEQAIRESEGKYGPLCHAIAWNILAQEQDAEECVNDTWLHAWNAMPPQRPAVLSAFFGRLTRNLSLDRLRYNRAAKRGGSQVEAALEELEDCLPAPGRPEEHLDAAETAAAISRFLREQPPLERNLFLRRYWYLDPISELSRRFRLTQGQVKSKLHRTRLRLKEALLREGVVV